MKITDNKPAGPLGAAQPMRSTAAAERVAGDAPATPRRIDTAAVLGIPEGELSAAVRAALQTLIEEVDRLRRELEQSRKRIAHLERLADEDPLAPIANRRAFVRELSRLMSFAERYGSTGAVLYFDVNDLKRINDRHGHSAGDAALKLIAEVLRANVRESDVVGRLGGDEFGVALAQVEPSAAAEKAAFLADAIVRRPLEWDGATIPLSVSWGAYPFSGAEQADTAIEAADRAMYDVKRGKAAAKA